MSTTNNFWRWEKLGATLPLALAVLVMFTLVACGDPDGNPASAPGSDPDGNLTGNPSGNNNEKPNDKPIELSKTLQLTEQNWKAILTEIAEAGNDVILDLSGCTRSDTDSGGGLRSDGTFDPIYDFSTGKDSIVSLILPNTATSITDGDHVRYYHPDGNPYDSIEIRPFDSFSKLKSVSASSVTTIGRYAFVGCTSLTSVNFPVATSTGHLAFASCTSLISVSFPVATSIDDATFSRCTSLTNVSFPMAIIVGNWAFAHCTSLTSVNLPAATSINNAFDGTGTTALTITLGQNAPRTDTGLFFGITAKTVTVKVPDGAVDYGTIPATYSGTNATVNWGNGFRGGGWNGSGFRYEGASSINSNITLHIEYQ
jgi:hypothetical protein